MRESFGIAAFRSRQQVMRFENALRREGIFARVVTTPREVAMGCGLSVRFELNDLSRVKSDFANTVHAAESHHRY